MPVTSAIIFDLDDTLYPERAFAFSGFAAVARAFQDVMDDPAGAAARMRELFDTGHRGRIFNQMLRERGLTEDAELIRRMIRVYRTHEASISLYPDAEAALTRLRPTHRLGVLTDGPAAMQRTKLEALKLLERLDVVLVTDELGPGSAKPHMRAFLMAAERLGVQHSDCTYVADNPTKDFIAPNALGWRTIRIIRPEGVYRDAVAATGGEPQHRIETLDQLDPLVG